MKGEITTKQLRQLLTHGKGVDEVVINDIVRTLDEDRKGVVSYKELIDLYSRISFGVRYTG